MNSQTVFEKNLATFRKRCPQLAKSLESTELGDVVTGQGPRGKPTITDDGILLASAYDPESEGDRLAEEMNRREPDLMIAVGFGLGYHLEAFRRRNKCPLIVFEPSRARLRAALSVRADLKILSGPDVFVVDDLSDLQNVVSLLYTSGLRTGVFPLPSLIRVCPELVRTAVGRVSQAKNANDVSVNTRVQMLAKWARVTAGNGAHFRDTPRLSRLSGAFAGVTAVVVCAGPSLTKQLPRLKKMRDRVLVVSIGQAVGALRQAGIEPDFVHVLESLPVLHQLEKGGSSDTLNLVVSPDVHGSLFECPTASRFVMVPDANKLARWLARTLGDEQYQLGGGSVAHGAVSVATALGARRIVLLGQDLAFTNGEAYASGSVYAETGFEQTEGGTFRWRNIESKHSMFESLNWELRNPEQELLWVDGWYDEKVPTSNAYASFIDQYMTMALLLAKQDVELINCTEGGARIPKMRHARFEEIEKSLGDRLDARRIIQGRLDDWPVPLPGVFDSAIAFARKTIDALEKEARRGLKEAERGYKILSKRAPQDQEVKIVDRDRKLHRKIGRRIKDLPWLDDIIQPELQAIAPMLHRAKGTPATAKEALQISILQFRSIEAGVGRARPLLDRLAEALATRGDTDSSTVAGDLSANPSKSLDQEFEQPSYP